MGRPECGRSEQHGCWEERCCGLGRRGAKALRQEQREASGGRSGVLVAGGHLRQSLGPCWPRHIRLLKPQDKPEGTSPSPLSLQGYGNRGWGQEKAYMCSV